MEMIRALCYLLLPVTVAFAQRPAQGAHALIGTWRVVEFADLDKDGKWQYRFGEHPRGYFVYDVTGHVHIQIMKVPALPPFPEAKLTDGKPPSPEHALAAYTAYVAYFGNLHRRSRETRGDTSCRGQLSAGFHRHPPAASLQTGRRPTGDRGWQDLAACAGTCALILRTPAELRVGTRPSRCLTKQ